MGNIGFGKPLTTPSFTTAATTSNRLLVPQTTTPWTSSVVPSLSIGIANVTLDSSPFTQTTRTMVTRKKRLARRVKRRLEAKRAANSDGKVRYSILHDSLFQ
jgi:hypothetical protein